MSNVKRLPLIPLAVPVQLVLGLPDVGIKPARVRRRRLTWFRPTGEKAAA